MKLIVLCVTDQWERILEGEAPTPLEACLPDVLKSRRWFAGKARVIQSVRIVESVPILAGLNTVVVLLILVEYVDGAPEMYTFPLTAAFGAQAARIQEELPGTVVTTLTARIKDREQTGILYDALWSQDFSRTLLSAIGRGDRFTGETGTLMASPTQAYPDLINGGAELEPAVLKAEQSNTSVAYGDRGLLKVYRRIENGINPDLEIGRILTTMNFPHSPPLAGSLEYVRANDETVTVAILQGFVHNHGDAWKYTLEAFDQFLVRCSAQPTGQEHALTPAGTLTEMAQKDIPALALELIGPYLDSAARIGQRTGELHVALADVHNNPDFTPEPFSLEYRQCRYASMCRLASQTCSLLKERLNGLPSETEQEARRVVNDEPRILDRYRAFLELEARALRIRCHGDYHLGQVLWTGQDFVITDFEGEPARPLSERRMKHTPIVDVAGMLRSFYYVPYAALSRRQSHVLEDGAGGRLDPWIRFWYGWVSLAFLKSYVGIVERASFWPESQVELLVLLDAHLLEKVVYEVSYELNHRPEWVRIPVRGLWEILETTTNNAR